MPGNVALANPTAVLPNSLCAAFAEVRTLSIRANTYVDGSYQCAVVSSGPRRAWAIGKRLTLSQWEALRIFYLARRGPVEPFWWYPLQSQFDADGSSTTGRILVRFDGGLSRTYSVGRQDASLRLVEIA